MKLAILTSGLLVFSMNALAAGQQVQLGNDETYSIDGMKDRCRLFQSSSQLKPFSIRIECSKTENRWDAVVQKRPLPMWVKYSASGVGKGMIAGENVKDSLPAEEYECTSYQEKTLLFKGYVELSCNEFIENVSSLKSLCAEGFVSKNGADAKVDWVQVGEAETGTQFTSGCQSEIGGQPQANQGQKAQAAPQYSAQAKSNW